MPAVTVFSLESRFYKWRSEYLKGDLILMLTNNFQFNSPSLRRAMRVLLIACCCMAFAAITQAQSSSHDFFVHGLSGPAWVDTGLYLPPNTLVYFTVTGEVDVSAGWGSHGPGGTHECAPVSGYPIDPRDPRLPLLAPQPCYGLAARLTEDATRVRPFRVLAEWTYSDLNRYFGGPRGGHFWLTVNDDNPDDNTGGYKVHVEVTTFPPIEILCQPCPFDRFDRQSLLGQPLPEPKGMQALLAFDGEIIAINQSGGTTLVTASPGSVLAKYGDLPNLKVIFAKDAARLGPSLSKEGVVQGVVFQNKKMSLITGASPLKFASQAYVPETKPDTKQTKPD